MKLPKYLSQQWSEASGSGEVGKLQIAKNRGKSEISFILNKELTDIRGTDGQPAPVIAPREHQLVLQGVRGQVLTVLSVHRISSPWKERWYIGEKADLL